MKPIYLKFAAALAISFAVAATTPTQSQVADTADDSDNWLSQPQTPGDWQYVAEPGETLALYGTGDEAVHLFVLRCELRTRRIGIARRGTANGQLPMRIRTETQQRMLTANQVSDNQLIAAELAASDDLLDAIALSRGRFAIEVEGFETLYLPAWAEVTRVIEDCR